MEEIKQKTTFAGIVLEQFSVQLCKCDFIKPNVSALCQTLFGEVAFKFHFFEARGDYSMKLLSSGGLSPWSHTSLLSLPIILQFQILLSCFCHYLIWNFDRDYFESVDLFRYY